MNGLKPEKRFTMNFLRISDDGEIKLFGLLTVRKGRKKEDEGEVADDVSGSDVRPGL